MWFKHEVKISDRNFQNWAGHRSNATCSHHYSFNIKGSFWVISWWVTNWVVQQNRSSPSVFRTSTPIVTLIGNSHFFELSQKISGQKCHQKYVILSFLGYLDEIESDPQTVWTCICTTAPRSVLPIFQVLICSGWRASTLMTGSFIRFLAGPARTGVMSCEFFAVFDSISS